MMLRRFSFFKKGAALEDPRRRSRQQGTQTTQLLVLRLRWCGVGNGVVVKCKAKGDHKKTESKGSNNVGMIKSQTPAGVFNSCFSFFCFAHRTPFFF